jgi:exonuclease VII small subunit
MQEYEKIKQLVASLEEDVIKFYEKGNNLAGTRVRKGLQELKKAAQDMRIAVQSAKKDGSAE